MKRIMIIGCCGAGKSTLSRNLGEVTGLSIYHLDQHYWKENWTETPKEKWEPVVTALAAKDAWLIDGNYGGTMDIRFDRADTVIYLQYSTIRCLYRVIKRITKYNGTVRPDMPEGCPERFNLEFLHYVATYNLIRGRHLITKVSKLGRDKRVIILKNDSQVARFLQNIDDPQFDLSVAQ